MNNNASESEDTLLFVLIPSVTCATLLIIIIIIVLTLCAVKRICVTKETSEDPNQQPTYEEITQCYKDILMEENAAYGNITRAPLS